MATTIPERHERRRAREVLDGGALGGVVARIGTNNIVIIKFPNVLLLMRVQKPTTRTKGGTDE